VSDPHHVFFFLQKNRADSMGKSSRLKTTSPTLTIAVLLGCVLSPLLLAEDASYLREMPSTEQVIADSQGDDPLDTRARQSAALFVLLDVMKQMAGRRWSTGPFPNAVEKPIVESYAKEANRLRNEGKATFPPGGMNSPGTKWLMSIERYHQSEEFNDQLMRRYFSAAFQARYRAMVAAQQSLSTRGRKSINQGLRDMKGTTNATWDRMTEEEQQGAMAFAGLMCLLLAIGALRELRKFGVVSSNPPELRLGFAKACLHWATGVISDYRKWEKTYSTLWERTSATGDVSQFWTSHTYMHEEFDLVAASGSHHVHTVHETSGNEVTGEFDRYIGRTITAMWATRRWRKTGRYVMFREPGSMVDITAAEVDKNISKLLAPRGWTILPFMGLAFVIGSSTDLLPSSMSSSFRGVLVAAMSAFLWLAIFLSIAVIRGRRFNKHETPKLRALIG
jgi:hypothetical protein